MEISAKKRVRSSNWDEEEKRLLRQLVIERINIIENKDTSTNTNSRKKSAWQEVLSCFNSLNNKKRDMKEITTQWRNTKGKVKSRDSEYRRAKLMTGGGPPPASPPAEDLAIIEAIPNEFVIDSNCFDSDSHYKNTFTQSTTSGSNDTMTLPASSIHVKETERILDDYIEKPEQKNMKCNDPWTPLPAQSTQKKKIEEIPDDDNDYSTTERKTNKNDKEIKRFKQHKKGTNKGDSNYEQELFLITKLSKERENERAEEIHKKRMAIMDLEYQYWKKKFNEIE